MEREGERGRGRGREWEGGERAICSEATIINKAAVDILYTRDQFVAFVLAEELDVAVC